MARGVASILVRGGGDIGQNIIHDSIQVMYCSGSAKMSARIKDIQQKFSQRKLLKNLKNFVYIRTKILENFPKFFKKIKKFQKNYEKFKKI